MDEKIDLKPHVFYYHSIHYFLLLKAAEGANLQFSCCIISFSDVYQAISIQLPLKDSLDHTYLYVLRI